MRKSICIMSLSDIETDSRVLRQIRHLSPIFDLTVIGYGPPHREFADASNIRWIRIEKETQPAIPRFLTALKNHDLRNIRFFTRIRNKMTDLINRGLLLAGRMFPQALEFWYRRQTIYREIVRRAIDARCHAYHANDANTLLMAYTAAEKNNAPLVLDLHEYTPLRYREGPTSGERRRLFHYALQRYVPRVDVVITVAEPLAVRYKAEYGFRPVVIMNTSEKVPLQPLVMNGSSIRIIHHGILSRGRQPELMIQTIARCDGRYSLHLMLMPHEQMPELKRLAEDLAPGRVFFHDPVPPEEIVSSIACFDVGLCLFPPVNYSSYASLPNKFFDFICAGLAVCTGPSPSMAPFIKKYGFGVACETFEPEDIATLLNRTSAEQWMEMRKAAIAASDELNAQVEMKKLVKIYENLLPQKATAQEMKGRKKPAPAS